MTILDQWYPAAYFATAQEEQNLSVNPKPVHDAASLPSDWAVVNGTNSTYTYTDGGTYDGIISKHVNIVGAAGCNAQAGVQVKMRSTAGDEMVAGQSVTVSARIGEATLTGCTLRWRIEWFNAAGGSVSYSYSSGFTPGSAFTLYSLTATVPATATNAKVCLLAANDFGSGDAQDYSICKILVTNTASAAPVWWDGDRANCRWDDEPDASKSYKSLARPVSGYWTIEDNSLNHKSAILSPGISVAVGRTYGASALVAVPVVAGGSFSVDILFYDADDTYVIGYSLMEGTYLTAVTPEALYSYSVAAPLTATQARLRLVWNGDTTPTGDCRATVRECRLGEGIGEVPAVIPVSGQNGDLPAPWIAELDGSEQDIAALYAGRYPDETSCISDFAFKAVDLDWYATGGGASSGADSTEAAGYPDGTGNTVFRNQSATEDYADIDLSGLRDGQYLVLPKCKRTSSQAATIRHTFCGATAITTTTLGLLPLGVVTVSEASGSTLRIYLAGDGTGYGYLNAVFMVPVGFGGFIGWRDSGGGSVLLWDGDLIYVDGAADLSGALSARPILGTDGSLVVVAELATPAPMTALATKVDVTPRFEHFPHE